MIQKLKSYWNYGSTYCAVDCSLAEGADRLNAVTSKYTNGEFIDVQQFSSDSFSSLSNEISKGQHCVLVMNTDKVLIKTIPKSSQIDSAVVEAFPGIELSEFFYEVVEGKDHYYVSVCKRSEVHRLINLAQTEKLEIVGVRIGFGVIKSLLSVIDATNVVAGRWSVMTSGGAITDFNGTVAKNETYVIEGVRVNSDYLLSSAALSGYLGSLSLVFHNLTDFNFGLKKGYFDKVFFKKGLRIAVGTLLLLALVNFLFFSSYRQKLTQLSAEQELVENQSTLYGQRKQSVEKKEKLVSNLLQNGNSRVSYYMNRLVASKPETIIFQQINYQPLARNIRPDKPIEARENELIVTGRSVDKEDFGSWLEQLENYDWVEGVSPISFGQDKSGDNFSLQLKIYNVSTK